MHQEETESVMQAETESVMQEETYYPPLHPGDQLNESIPGVPSDVDRPLMRRPTILDEKTQQQEHEAEELD